MVPTEASGADDFVSGPGVHYPFREECLQEAILISFNQVTQGAFFPDSEGLLYVGSKNTPFHYSDLARIVEHVEIAWYVDSKVEIPKKMDLRKPPFSFWNLAIKSSVCDGNP